MSNAQLEISKPAAPPSRSFAEVLPTWWTGPQALAVFLFILLVLLDVVPLATVITSSLRPSGLPLDDGWTFGHYREFWSSGFTYVLVWNSLVFALASTTFSVVAGGALAWIIERTDAPGGAVFRAGILMPMAMPSLLLAVGWVLLTSREIGAITNLLVLVFGEEARQLNIYSLGGMIFVQGLAGVPLAFLIFSPAMRSMNPAFEEAALMSGARFSTILRRISLPFLVPSILSVFTLQAIVGLLAFDVPAILGLPGNVPVISAEIYNLMNPIAGLPNYGATAAVNASMLLPIGLGLGVYYYATRKSFQFATVSGKGYRATRFRLGRWKPLGFLFVATYFLAAVVLPFLAVLWVSLTPYFAGFEIGLIGRLSLGAYASLLSSPEFWQSALNSVLIATVVSVALLALAVLVGWCVLRSGSAFARAVDILAMAPMAVPHLMMGVSLIFIFFTLKAIPIYGTIWIIALGHLVVYMPQACRMMQVAMLQVHQELEESATVCGASMSQKLQRIVVPLVAPMLGAIFLWVFIHSMREFSIAVTLRSGRNEVLSTMLFSYWDNGRPQSAAAMAVILMLTLAGLVALSRMRRFGATES